MSTGDVKSMLGSAIRKHRAKLRISQEELAYRAGLHRTYISDVERGSRNVSLESIEKIAHALGMSVAKLFALAAEPQDNDGLIEILLVEDNPNDVELTFRAFRRSGIVNPLLVANDGVQALEILFAQGLHETRRNQPLPGVILLDLGLPRLSGLEVLRRIKSEAHTQRIPVIVLTVSNQDADIAACKRLGVEDYIVKPVEFRNFSEVTPGLLLDWALKKRTSAELKPEFREAHP